VLEPAVLGGGLGWLVGIGALAIPVSKTLYRCWPDCGGHRRGGSGRCGPRDHGSSQLEWESRNMKPKRFEGRVKDGGILLSVHSDSSEWTKKAKELLERTCSRIPRELPPHLCHPVA